MIPNLESLTAAATGLDPHDWTEFAIRCAKLSAPLGVVVSMHAEAADGNSPDVQAWPAATLREWDAVDGMDAAQAREWWIREYEDPIARRGRLSDSAAASTEL